MRSISFKNLSYLRNGAQRIEIEDKHLDFQNGLAIAKAKVYCNTLEKSFSSYTPKTYTYTCEGLINEKYEEAFLAKQDNDQAKYFMFCRENQKIRRFGTNDYIVERLEKIQGKWEKRYTHLKVIDGKIFTIKEHIKDFSFTSMEDIVILDHQFYIVSVGKFYGLKFTLLKEDENHLGEFIVVDKIITPHDDKFPILDVLTYRMNKDFQLTSFVYSLLEGNSPIFTQSTDCNKIRNERIDALQKKKEIFQQELSYPLENKPTSLVGLPDFVIRDNQFYNRSMSKPYGPKFLFLKEDRNKPGEFIVMDRIVVPSTHSTLVYPVIDILTFRMNKNFQVLNVPKSLIEEREVYFTTNNYYKIRQERINQLVEKRNSFHEKIESLEQTYKR